ncbi:MAG TPA: hypothetical protein VK524_16380, partial [Polyangiaceae bacterium]|nr:hypothetical protein [Polyangiaceae bacterium]
MALLTLVTCLSCDKPRLQVSTTEDGVRGSLRAAVDAANRTRRPAKDVIVIELPAGEYVLDVCGKDDDNEAGDLDVTVGQPVRIVGSEPYTLIRQACAGERVIDRYGPQDLELVNVTLRNGNLVSAEPGEAAHGGAVRTDGNLKLRNVLVTECSAQAGPGRAGDDSAPPVDGGAARGGAVYVGGSLEAIDSSLTYTQLSAGDGGSASASGERPSQGGPVEGGGAYVVGSVKMTNGSVGPSIVRAGAGGTGVAAAAGGMARGGGVAQAEDSSGVFELSAMHIGVNLLTAGASGSSSGNDTGPTVHGGDALGGGLAAAVTVVATQLSLYGNSATGGSSEGCKDCVAGAARGGGLYAPRGVRSKEGVFSRNVVRSGNAFHECYPRCADPYNCPGYPCGPSHCFPPPPICTGANTQSAAGAALWMAQDSRIEGGSV